MCKMWTRSQYQEVAWNMSWASKDDGAREFNNTGRFFGGHDLQRHVDGDGSAPRLGAENVRDTAM